MKKIESILMIEFMSLRERVATAVACSRSTDTRGYGLKKRNDTRLGVPEFRIHVRHEQTLENGKYSMQENEYVSRKAKRTEAKKIICRFQLPSQQDVLRI